MKKLLFVMIWVATSFVAVGQEQDPKTILDKMSAVYKAMLGYEIGFIQKILSEAEVVDRLTGEASVSKEQFKIKFQDQHIYCNGTVLWTYLVESQELTISNFEPEEAMINPSNVYDIYKEGFTYEYKRADNMGGEMVHVVELISTDEDADFTNVIMYIGQNDSYLKAWDLVDYAGAKTAFEVSSFKPNVNFPEGFFEFDEENNPVQYKEDLRNE